jgi:hypothetical protein
VKSDEQALRSQISALRRNSHFFDRPNHRAKINNLARTTETAQLSTQVSAQTPPPRTQSVKECRLVSTNLATLPVCGLSVAEKALSRQLAATGRRHRKPENEKRGSRN